MRIDRLALTFIVVVSATWPTAEASAPLHLLSEWHRAQRVLDLVQTPDGYLWAATDSGLLRFDGVRFENLTRRDGVGLASNIISALAVGPDGALWIGTTRPAGLSVLRDGRIELVMSGGGRPDMAIDALAFDGVGVLWVGSNEGLYTWQHGTLVRAPSSTRLAAISPRGLVTDDDGRLWVASEQGLFTRTDGTFEPVITGAAVMALIRDPGRGMLAAVRETGLVAISAQGETRMLLSSAPPPSQGDFTTAEFDRDGKLWLGWVGGYGYVDRERPDHFIQKFSNGLRTLRVLRNPHGGVWVATYWGNVHHVGAKVVRVPDVSAGDVVFSLTQTPDGALWASYANAVVRMRGDDVDVYRVGKELPFFCPRAITPKSGGGVWVGDCGDGVFSIDEGRVEPVVPGGADQFRNARGLLRDRKGRLWLATGLGQLFEIRGGTLVPHDYGGAPCPIPVGRDVSCAGSISDMIESRAGGLWLGSEQGVFRFDPDRAPHHLRLENLPTDLVLSLHEDAQGALYIGTQANGLLRMRGGRIAAVDTSAGLPSQSIHGITADNAGNLWVSGERGVARIVKSELDAYYDGKRSQVRGYSYGVADGMESLITMQSFTSTIRTLADGRIAAATAKGVAVIETARATDSTGFFPVLLEELRLAGRPVQAKSPDAFHRVDLALAQLSLGPVSFRFTAPNFSVPHRLRFEYRMNGHDGGWITADERRIAEYPALPAGKYRFETRVWLEDRLWQPAKTLARLDIVAFHQRPVFLAFIAACLLPIAGFIYILRLRQARARFGAVLAERNRIALDLHDSLAQYFTGMAYQLEQLDMLIGEDDAGAREVNRETKEIVTRCRLESRHTIHDLRSETMDPPTLEEGLDDLVEQTRLYGKVRIEFAAPAAAPVRPDPLVRRGLLRIAREAVVNALAHGAPEHVRLQVEYPPGEVILRISDDGRGFDPDSPGDGSTLHHGLVGMKERAAGLGGCLKVTSAPGAGTTIEVRARL